MLAVRTSQFAGALRRMSSATAPAAAAFGHAGVIETIAVVPGKVTKEVIVKVRELMARSALGRASRLL